ncbi:MAG: prepilin-type N-terminal cleavage/methylation domain-containing protein [Patescibacteria group bacterium]
MNKKGFTLIELLVTIAIIAILSGIAITLLGGARSGANDAAVKQQLNNLKTEMNLAIGELGSYSRCGGIGGTTWTGISGTGCQRPEALFDNDGLVGGIDVTKMKALLLSAQTSAGGLATSIRVKVNDTDGVGAGITGTEWAVAAKLPSDSSGNSWWCVDSANVSKFYTAPSSPTPIFSDDTNRAYCL